MKTQKFTQDQKNQYFAQLREEWQAAKTTAKEQEERINLAIKVAGLEGISLNGFVLLEKQMENQGLPGVPVLDAKTFQKWKDEGYTVKKGEKATLHGITFISAKSKKQEKKTVKNRQTSQCRRHIAYSTALKSS